MQRDSKRTKVWFPLFSYFESQVDGIVPNQYEWPITIERLKTWGLLSLRVLESKWKELVPNPNEGFLRTKFFFKPAAALKKETGGGAHGVLITAPSLIAFKQGIGMTRKRGTCSLVGLPPGEFPVPLFDVVANCITIRGSFVGTREDMAEALDFAVRGKVKADIELQPLSEINNIFTRLEHGDVAARVVLEFK